MCGLQRVQKLHGYIKKTLHLCIFLNNAYRNNFKSMLTKKEVRSSINKNTEKTRSYKVHLSEISVKFSRVFFRYTNTLSVTTLKFNTNTDTSHFD